MGRNYNSNKKKIAHAICCRCLERINVTTLQIWNNHISVCGMTKKEKRLYHSEMENG